MVSFITVQYYELFLVVVALFLVALQCRSLFMGCDWLLSHVM